MESAVGRRAGRRASGGGGRPAAGLAVRLNPDIALVHEPDLLVDHFPAVLVMRIGSAIEIEVPRVDRLLVDELVLLGGEVLQPVVRFRASAETARSPDVEGSRLA